MDADRETDLQASNASDDVLVERRGVGKLTVPVLPLIDSVIFPNSVYPLTLQGEQAASLAQAAEQAGGYVAIFQQRSAARDASSPTDLHTTGTLSRLTVVRGSPEAGTFDAEAVGVARVRLVEICGWEPHASATVQVVPDAPDDPGLRLRYSSR